ncbi:hypothetical protein [Phycicoccus sp. Soil748]|uniref:hypothetical protein n=1 Tax=Phycicoccus sp. Soil748 TaxID=1736397 RepID=UPI000703365A|nr:hypothetical protein [Phycicoccus sp. Soil748]KRE54699.1 hypothetical protein ASG70_11150 [Phycicoccus sp. Soil748]
MSVQGEDPFVENEMPQGFGASGTARLDARRGRKERWYLTYWLLLLTSCLTLAVLAIAVWAPGEVWTRLTSQVGFLLTPFHTLLGIAIGYYFADKRRQE